MARPGESRHVVLIHGLWMNKYCLHFLARKLRSFGFYPHLFGYSTIRSPIEEGVDQLCEFARSMGSERLHFVGHSLGGIVALRAIEKLPSECVGRAVLLGTPLGGSQVAQQLMRYSVTNFMLGVNRSTLQEGLGEVQIRVPTAMIAGIKPLGIGSVLPLNLSGAHDGTVLLEETRHPGLAEHHVVEQSHTTMLISSEVAKLVAGFLRS